MRLTDIDIARFGFFENQKLEGLPGGLLLIEGANEAGKSTLLAFLRGCLFGFPTANMLAYIDTPGGPPAGRLGLRMDDGRAFWVERGGGGRGEPAIRIRESTAPAPTQDPGQLLGVTRELFEQVYAFSLNEFQEKGGLDSKELRDAIYGATMGVRGNVLSDARAHLKQGCETLYRPRARRHFGRVDGALRELAGIRTDLQRIGNEAAAYDQKQGELETLHHEVLRLDTEVARARGEHDAVRNLLASWEIWQKLQQREQDLDELPEPPPGFPADGAEQSARLREKLRENAEQTQNEAAALAGKQAALDGLKVNDALLECAEKIDALAEDRKRFAEHRDALPVIQARLEEIGRTLQRHLDALGGDTGTLEAPPETDGETAALEALQQEKARFADVADTLPADEERLQTDRENIARKIAETVPGWTRAEAERLDTSFQAREQVRQFAEQLRDAHDKCADTERERQYATRALNEKQRQCAQQQQEVARLREQMPATCAELEAQQAALAEWRVLLAARERTETDIRHTRERMADRATAPAQAVPWWLAGLAAAVVALLAGYGFLRGEMALGAVMAALTLLAAAIPLLLRTRGPRPGAPADALNTRLDELRQEHQSASERLAHMARHYGWNAEGGLAEAERLLAAQHKALALLERRENAEAELARQHAGLEHAGNGVAEWTQRAENAQAALQQVNEAWRAHLQEAGLPETLDPGQAERVLERIGGLNDLARQCDAQEQRVERLRQFDRDYRARAREVATLAAAAEASGPALLAKVEEVLHQRAQQMETLGAYRSSLDERDRLREQAAGAEAWVSGYLERTAEVAGHIGAPVPGRQAAAESVAHWQQAVREQRETRAKRTALETELREYAARVDTMRKQRGALEAQQRALFGAAGAADETEFLQRAELDSRRRTLEAEIAAERKRLLDRTHAASLETLAAELAATSREELEVRAARARRELEENETARAHAQEETGRLRGELEQLAHSDTVAELRRREEGLIAQVQADAQTWRRYALAQWLLQTACDRFAREQTPEALRGAETFFKRVTGGRYTVLNRDLETSKITVCDADGREKAAEELSRGAAEQLYLSLRFGYVRVRAEHGEPLPVVMDDILVNFDPDRQRRAAETIAELAREQQVLFFTCHPSVCALFQEVDKDTPVLRLENGRFSA